MMKQTPLRHRSLQSSPRLTPRRLVLALAACSLFGTAAQAVPTLPTGLQVAQGQASAVTKGNQLTITNSNGAILNWSSFSIGAANAVNFVQPSSTSQVLNRVTGNDPSQILGSLSSNGRVWLLNPNGVLFGQGAQVNVAGLVTSTLNLNDQDWTAGRYLFTAPATDSPAASIVNQGQIRSSSGGQVLMLAGEGGVRNEGVIEAPGGQIVLAAGNSIELMDTATPRVTVKVTAPEGEVVNLGSVTAAGGRIDVQAATVNQQGIVRADALSVGPSGEIVINASNRLTLAAGSTTSADSASGTAGQIELLGNQVALLNGSVVSASGTAGGGTVLVGGGAQGKDASVPNADAVYFAPGASISADATSAGDGGHIVLWSNSSTRAYGTLSAVGGPQGGNGGLVETSGGWLDAQPLKLDVSAPKGKAGTWLLDPYDVTIDDTPGDTGVTNTGGVFTPTAEGSHIYTGTIAGQLNAGTNVNITTTSSTGSDLGDIDALGTITVNAAAPGSLTLTADHGINYNGAIHSQNGPLAVTLLSGNSGPGTIVLNGADIETDGGNITLGGNHTGTLPNGSTFSGAANGATGVGVTVSNSTLNAGSGQINIYGTGNAGGVVIQSTSNMTAGDITILGYSAASDAVDVSGFSNIGATHSVTVQGNGGDRGISVSNGGNFYVVPPAQDTSAFLNLTGLGGGFAEGVLLDNSSSPGVILRVINGAALNVSAANQTGGNAALSLIGESPSTLMVDAGNDGPGAISFSTSGSSNTLSLSNVYMTAPAGGLTLSSAGDLSVQNSVISGSVGAVPVTLLAGSSLSGSGAISLSAVSISSNGGDITLGGFASGPLPQGGTFSGAATSQTSDAVNLTDSQLNAGNGNISMAGVATGSGGRGVSIATSEVTTSLTGSNITITGSATSGSEGVAVIDSNLTSTASMTLQGTASNGGTGVLVSGASNLLASPGVSSPGSTLSLVGTSDTGSGIWVNINDAGSVQAANGTALSLTATDTQSENSGSTMLITGALQAGSGGALTLTTMASSDSIQLNGAQLTGSHFGITVSGAGSLSITGSTITSPGTIQLLADNIDLESGTTITSSQPSGQSILLAGNNSGPLSQFTNDAGSGVLATEGGSWIIWASDITSEGFLSGGLPYNFTRYGATTAAAFASDAGNGFVSAGVQNATLTGNAEKTYDGTTSFTGFTNSLAVSTQLGTATINGTPAMVSSSKDVGSPTVTFADPATAVSYVDAAGKPIYGIGIISGINGQIDPKTLTLTLAAQDKVYDSTTGAIVNVTNTSGLVGSETLNLSAFGGFQDKNVGSSKPVNVEVNAADGTNGGLASNYTLSYPTLISANITPATLTLNGLVANSKVYDSTTAATVTGSASVTPFSGDDVTLSGSAASASFSDKNVGTGKTVTVTGFSLSGSDAGNYVVGPLSTTADITPYVLALNGLTAASKVYDATTAASVSGTASVSTPFSGDNVSLTGSVTGGTFADKNVGTAKPVTVGGISLTGSDAGNYLIGTLSADITPAPLVINGLTAASKVYDTTTNAALSGTPSATPLAGDNVVVGGELSGSFADKNVGTAKPVSLSGVFLGGTDGGNYVAVAPASLVADITPATLALSGLFAQSKVYDSTTAATVNGTASITPLGGDSVTLTGGVTGGSFADKNVGTGKVVTVNGLSLAGADAGNYTLGTLVADITPATLAVSGLTANSKTYDATTAATFSGTATISPFAGDNVVLAGPLAGIFDGKDAGPAIHVTVNVGDTGLSLSGTDAGNYILVGQAGLSANINKAPLTLTGLSASNKVYDSTTVATVSGSATLNGYFAGDVVGISGTPGGNFSDKNVGTGKTVTVNGVTLTGTDAGNYTVSGTLTADITPFTLSLNGLSANGKVYDATTAATVSGSASITPFSGDNVSLTGSATGGTFADKNVGTAKPVTVNGLGLSGSDAGNYTLGTLSADITPATLLINGLTAASKVYDATTSVSLSGTASATPFAGDNVTVGGEISGAFVDKNVGTGKQVILSGVFLGGTDRGNYVAVASPTLVADITPATLTLAGLFAQSKVYDSTTAATVNGQASISPLGEDSVSLSGSIIGGSFADKNVGTGKTVTVNGLSLVGADAGNYTLGTLAADITPATVAVSGLTANSKTYDATTIATFSGVASVNTFAGDNVSLSGPVAGNFDGKNAGPAIHVTLSVGEGGLFLSGSDAGNYVLVGEAGLSADINKATLTLSGLTASNKVYDTTTTATLTGNALLSGVFAGDVVGSQGTPTASFADKNVGNGKVVNLNTANVGLVGTDAGNYTLSAPALSANITQASVVVSGFSAQNKVYDATTVATITGSGSVTALGDDSVTVSGTPVGSFQNKNVGVEKTVTITGLTLSGPDAGNYTIANAPISSADITPATLTVNGLSAANKVYNGLTNATISGNSSVSAFAGDDVGLIGGSASFSDKNVGTNKTVSGSGFALSGTDAGNYVLVQPTFTASITPATLTVNGLAAGNKVYDATTVASITGSASVTGFSDDNVSVTGSALGSFADKNVGTAKPVSVSGLSLSGSDAGNYVIASPSLTADITPRGVAVQGLTANSKVYDAGTAATVSGTATVAALAGDSLAVGGSLQASFSDKNVGTGKAVTVTGLSLTGADAGNYVLTSSAVQLSAAITPANLVVSGLSAGNKVYDASTQATIAGNAAITPLGSDALTIGGTATGSFSDKNVGTAKPVTVSGLTLGGADAGNYVLVEPSGLAASITPANLVVSGLTANGKVYDTTTVASLSGSATATPLAGDSVSISGTAVGAFADKNVGTAKPVTVSGLTLGGADAGNYQIVEPGLAASITPATLAVSGLTANNKVYDATTVATLGGNAAVTPLAGDSVSLSGTANASFADKNVGNAKLVTVNGLGLSGADAGNYTVALPTNLSASITPANLLVTGLTANGKVYDATTAASLTGSAAVQGLAGDAVSLSGSAVGAFADKNVGTAKPVTVSGLTLGGADAGNYQLVEPTGLTASITPLNLTVSGLTAASKVYDGTVAATVSGTAALNPLAGDQVSVSGSALAVFSDKNVGADKLVTITGGLSLTGADAGNYRVVPPNLSASITPATLVYVADAVGKALNDPLPALTGTVTGFVAGESQATATSGSLAFTTPATAASPMGSYAVNGGGLSAQNYQFVQAPGNATALTVGPPTVIAPDPTNTQATTVAINSTAATTTATAAASTSTSSVLDLTQATGAGVASSAALAAVTASPAQSFGALPLGSMSMEVLSSLLASRDQYKQALFADATVKLLKDPGLADARPCASLKDAESGACLITDALKRESREHPGEVQAIAATTPVPAPASTAALPAPAPAVVAAPVAALAPPAASPAVVPLVPVAPVVPQAPAAPVLAAALPETPPFPSWLTQPSRRRVLEAALPQIQRKVAVVIGVDEYRDSTIPSLGGAVSDAEAVGKLFAGNLGYETVVIPNASKAAVIGTLNRLALTMGPKDSVVIYYAGHGDLVQETGQGYWLLSDADAKRPETWLSNADIGRLINQIGASQVALISDSCYSGSLVSDERIRASREGVDPDKLLSQKSVVVMSSGGNEPVSDSGKRGHSPFSWSLMNQLSQVSKWQAGGNVFERVRFAVARELPQRPQYGASSAAGHQQGGDYLFEQRHLDPATP